MTFKDPEEHRSIHGVISTAAPVHHGRELTLKDPETHRSVHARISTAEDILERLPYSSLMPSPKDYPEHPHTDIT